MIEPDRVARVANDVVRESIALGDWLIIGLRAYAVSRGLNLAMPTESLSPVIERAIFSRILRRREGAGSCTPSGV